MICPECGTPVTPETSREDGLCVDCQEYNYYHQDNQTYYLFECLFETLDGEHGYTDRRYYAAPDYQTAGDYFVNMLLGWYGEHTKREDTNWVWNPEGTTATKIAVIRKTDYIEAEASNGKVIRYKFVPMKRQYA